MSESFVTVITFEEGKISAQEGKGSFYFLEKTEQRVSNWLSVGTSAQGTYNLCMCSFHAYALLHASPGSNCKIPALIAKALAESL